MPAAHAPHPRPPHSAQPAGRPPHGARGHGSGAAHHHAHGDHGIDLGRLLELDGEVHADLLDSATARLAALTEPAQPVRRILDIGAGAGNGTLALARRFPAADVVAVDIDPVMLERVRQRASAAGFSDRITTLEADVLGEMAGLGASDLMWASASLHEVADPERAFQNLFSSLRPGGLLSILEMDAPPRVLPAELADWEERVRAAGAGSPADHPDWTAEIADAGFDAMRTTQLVMDASMAADGPAGEYAALELTRVGFGVMDALELTDRERLRALIDGGDGPGGLRELGELWIRGTRTLWTARRP
ncbi:class I SAM-dependent methyltransferase [Brachybacterium alimentarium]|uniref:class I SAM-dependent methyltransferase n=1 Tax=Brachybacterium alimentarium TaxID=47845 RepID=UPI003FD1FBB4